MALEDIKKMTRPLSEEKQVATHASGDDVMQSAILWAAGLPQFGSVGSVLDALNNADHPHAMDMNGLVNAYMNAKTESN